MNTQTVVFGRGSKENPDLKAALLKQLKEFGVDPVDLEKVFEKIHEEMGSIIGTVYVDVENGNPKNATTYHREWNIGITVRREEKRVMVVVKR